MSDLHPHQELDLGHYQQIFNSVLIRFYWMGSLMRMFPEPEIPPKVQFPRSQVFEIPEKRFYLAKFGTMRFVKSTS